MKKIDESWANFWKNRVLMQYECPAADCSTPQDRRRLRTTTCICVIICDNCECDSWTVFSIFRCQLYHVEKAWAMHSIYRKSSICTQKSRCFTGCVCLSEVESQNRFSLVVSRQVRRTTYRKWRRVPTCRYLWLHICIIMKSVQLDGSWEYCRCNCNQCSI